MLAEPQNDAIFRTLEVRTRRLVEEQIAGEFLSAFKGRGTEFEEVRAYSPGDEVRSMDWNVTARTGVPHTKRSVEERELVVHLFVDISASVDARTEGTSKREAAAEIAGMLAWSAIRANDRVGLTLFSDRIEHSVRPGKGSAQVMRILSDTLRHPAKNSGTNLGAALDHLCRIAHRPCLAFLLSDFLCPGFADALGGSALHHDLVGITIRHACESALPDSGTVRMRDSETGHTCLMGTGDPAFRTAFAEEQGMGNRLLHQSFEDAGADHFYVQVGEDYGDRLHTFLKTRQQRKRNGSDLP